MNGKKKLYVRIKILKELYDAKMWYVGVAERRLNIMEVFEKYVCSHKNGSSEE